MPLVRGLVPCEKLPSFGIMPMRLESACEEGV